jgi:uncharacterized protein
VIIEISKLSPEGSRFTGEEPPDLLDLEPSSRIEVRSPIGYDLFAQEITGELLVRGRIWVELTLTCARCGDLFSTKLEDSSFLHAYSLQDEVLEVDLTEELRERVLLQLPSVTRCGETCKGRCPLCGANRNREVCDCRAQPFDPGWSAPLDGLKLEQKKVPARKRGTGRK